MNLRKTFFILPNLFTLASVFCGFFAIATVGGAAPRAGAFYQAAIAISFGFFFDLADGRVARLTRTQSALGMELDSLADVITFGAAPALLIFRFGLDKLEAHHLGMFISFLFVAAAALRLARFNVLAINEENEAKAKALASARSEGVSANAGFAEGASVRKVPGKYILGLPVPAAAAVLVSVVVLNYQLGGALADLGQAALAAMVVVLSYLMVSRVRFRSFKDLRPSRRTFTVGGGLAAASLMAVFWKRVPSAFVLALLLAAYLGLGLLEEVVFYRRRILDERAATAPNTVLEADGGARSDEEVLEELGAFDGDREETRAFPGKRDPVPPLTDPSPEKTR